MRLCIVPMKPLARAKERLAAALDAEQRRSLALAMLEDVVRAACEFDAVWVVNSDADAAEVAQRAGAIAVPDPTPDAGMNASLNAVTARAVTEGFSGAVVVSSDCACARTEDLRAMALGCTGVTLAPDRFYVGTNAIWRSPPDAIPLVFGERSRRAHTSLAHRRGVSCAVLPIPLLALDVDSPRDLTLAAATGPGPATRAVLDALGYPSRAGR